MADATRPRAACSIDGCGKPTKARGWCSTHYKRWTLHGDPLFGGVVVPRRRGPAPRCSFDGCGYRQSESGLCGVHHRQWVTKGVLTPRRQRAGVARWCTECGATDWLPNGRRSQCSSRCQVLASNRRLGRRSHRELTCEDCHQRFDISAKPGERKQRSDAKRCPDCRSRKTFKVTRGSTNVSIGVVRRLGTHCAICGEAVDFDLRAPDDGCPSVDHIVPVSLGGSDEWSNLQLAHLGCNREKNQGEVERGIVNTFYRTYPWKKFSRALREKEPDCRQCGAPAWATDHLVAIADGGAIWDPANLQSLCRRCHNTKSKAEYSARCAAQLKGAA